MESKIADTLKFKFNPVAITWTDEKPDKAIQFKKGKVSCVMYLFSAAAKGKTAVVDKETFGCFGGGAGLGFSNQYVNFPGGLECFYHFLSIGNEKSGKGKGVAREIGKFLKKEFLEDFLQGERYRKSPELVKKFVDLLPITQIPKKYVLFKPLKDVDPAREEPVVVIFTANPDQLSALVVLANFNRESNESVMVPFGAGCQVIGIYPYREAKSEHPRAVIGLIDISARKNLKRMGRDLFTFAMPLKMFKEMEGNVEDSFLQRTTWKSLVSASNQR